jgi:hypothetical protein
MAKFIPGPTISQARNKCGGIVYTRNRSGDVFKAWASPSQDPSPDRLKSQAIVRAGNLRWQNNLTDTQRLQWDLFARTAKPLSVSTLPGPLSGHDWYMRSYGLGQWWTGTVLDDPPAETSILTLGSLSATLNPATSQFPITFSPSPVPAGGVLAVWATPPLSPGITKPGNRYKPLPPIPAGTTSPTNIWAPFAAQHPDTLAGQKVFLKAALIKTTNNLLPPQISCLAVASSGSETMYSAQITLTNAQIKALATTPVTLVAAPGANYGLVIHDWSFALKYQAPTFVHPSPDSGSLVVSCPQTPQLQYSAIDLAKHPVFVNTENLTLASVLAYNLSYADVTQQASLPATDAQAYNTPIVIMIQGASGNMTVGGGTAQITLLYSIISKP